MSVRTGKKGEEVGAEEKREKGGANFFRHGVNQGETKRICAN